MKQITFVLLVMLVICRCKKTSSGDDGYYNVSALVLDFDANTPIAGATVKAATSLQIVLLQMLMAVFHSGLKKKVITKDCLLIKTVI